MPPSLKTSHEIVATHDVVVLEDLDIAAIRGDRSTGVPVSDAGFAEFRRQVTYKGAGLGRKVVIADRHFPSSKKCSRCGNVDDKFSRGERIYVCTECGIAIDRDLNAAINLMHYAASPAAKARGGNRTERKGGAKRRRRP